MTTTIWGSAIIAYALFWFWYVGFRPRITPQEAETATRLVQDSGHATEKQLHAIRRFLAEDDGKDFVMVNLLHLREPVTESRKKLETYQKIFLGQLLRKAGHPVFIARAASGNIENVAADAMDDWGVAAMVRYRSRRDFMEMLADTAGSEHHRLKLESMEKTFAFPAAPWFIFGGPRLVVGLLILVFALLAEIV